jgi:hypothetical protein
MADKKERKKRPETTETAIKLTSEVATHPDKNY